MTASVYEMMKKIKEQSILEVDLIRFLVKMENGF
jgi:hypothetical protein